MEIKRNSAYAINNLLAIYYRTYYSNVDLISKYNSDTVLSQKNQHNKNQFVDNKFYQQNDIYSSDDGTFKERVRIRSPSLPPISRNKMR